jgi:hypothetical protein
MVMLLAGALDYLANGSTGCFRHHVVPVRPRRAARADCGGLAKRKRLVLAAPDDDVSYSEGSWPDEEQAPAALWEVVLCEE